MITIIEITSPSYPQTTPLQSKQNNEFVLLFFDVFFDVTGTLSNPL